MTPTRALIEAAEGFLDHSTDHEYFKKLEGAISSAKAAEEGVDRAALLLIFKTAWNADRGRDNMELTLAYAEAVRIYGITQEELKEMAKEKPPERG